MIGIKRAVSCIAIIAVVISTIINCYRESERATTVRLHYMVAVPGHSIPNNPPPPPPPPQSLVPRHQ